MAALKFNTNLKELYLGRNNLNTDDSLHVAGIIKNNPHIEVLDLRDNSIQVCRYFVFSIIAKVLLKHLFYY